MTAQAPETQKALQDFRTDIALIKAYSEAHGEPDDLVADMKVKYVPHLYRGGKVIPGFGYSTQRIECGFVTADKAGDPALVVAK